MIFKNMLNLSCLDGNIKPFDSYACNFFYTLHDSGGIPYQSVLYRSLYNCRFQFLKA